jgi:hypothetical protein
MAASAYTVRQDSVDSLYRQFTDRMAKEAARTASGLACCAGFAWLEGEWTWCGDPVLFESAPYGISIQTGDEGPKPFLIHRCDAEMWLLVLSDPTSFGILIGLHSNPESARFTGDVVIDGEPVRSRQTWRRSEGAVEIEEERMENRRWIAGLIQRMERPLKSSSHAAP